MNEAFGYELTGDSLKARALAITLQQAFPNSSAAAALWVRTAPNTVGSAELEAEVRQFADREVDVALALSICSLKIEVTSTGRYAMLAAATGLESDLPQGWLLLSQAEHVRAFQDAHAERRLAMLQQAEAHYSRTVELAHAHKAIHIEAVAHLNRGIVRDLLGDSSAEEDYRTARRLAPRDTTVMRKYAQYLANHGQIDRAVQEMRAALQPLNQATHPRSFSALSSGTEIKAKTDKRP